MEELTAMCKRHSIKEGRCIIACDGISVLNTATKATMKSISAKGKCPYLISECLKLRVDLPIELIPQQVKGHQDDGEK